MASPRSVTHWFRRWTTRIRLSPGVNSTIQRLADPFRPSVLMPGWLWKRLPVVGTFSVPVCEGKSFLYRSIGEPLGKTLYWKGVWSYEEGTPHLFFQLARSAETFLDIGAHVGVYTLLAKIANPLIHIFAFEPVPFIWERLSEHVKLNRMGSGVELEQAAISDMSHEGVPFFVPKHPWATSASLIAAYKSTEKERILVNSFSLDDYVRNRDLEHVDLVKIDVEGAEANVLQGARETVVCHRPIIFCEILPQDRDALLSIEQFLERVGYCAALITPRGLTSQAEISPDETRTHKNYMLCPREKRDTVESLATQSISAPEESEERSQILSGSAQSDRIT